jgi:hypothetical protein
MKTNRKKSKFDFSKLKIGTLPLRDANDPEVPDPQVEKLPDLKYGEHVIKIKQLASLKIELTYDLSIFRKCPYNRDTDKKIVIMIIISALQYGWIIPTIYVNKYMEVLRGQHDVLAAMALGAPVYYVISEEMTSEELVTLEIRKNWTHLNALKAYAANGNMNAQNILNYYQTINLFLKKKKDYKRLTIPQLLALLYEDGDFIAGIQGIGGLTVFKNLKPFKIVHSEFMQTVDVFCYAQRNCMPEGASIRRQYPAAALVTFMSDKSRNIDLKKLRNKMVDYKFFVSANPDGYVKQLESHYS